MRYNNVIEVIVFGDFVR